MEQVRPASFAGCHVGGWVGPQTQERRTAARRWGSCLSRKLIYARHPMARRASRCQDWLAATRRASRAAVAVARRLGRLRRRTRSRPWSFGVACTSWTAQKERSRAIVPAGMTGASLIAKKAAAPAMNRPPSCGRGASFAVLSPLYAPAARRPGIRACSHKAAGCGRANRYPWPYSQRRARRKSNSMEVSIPSATTDRPRL